MHMHTHLTTNFRSYECLLERLRLWSNVYVTLLAALYQPVVEWADACKRTCWFGAKFETRNSKCGCPRSPSSPLLKPLGSISLEIDVNVACCFHLLKFSRYHVRLERRKVPVLGSSSFSDVRLVSRSTELCRGPGKNTKQSNASFHFML